MRSVAREAGGRKTPCPKAGRMELETWLEHATCALRMHCSTNWAIPAPVIPWDLSRKITYLLYHKFLICQEVSKKFSEKSKKRLKSQKRCAIIMRYCKSARWQMMRRKKFPVQTFALFLQKCKKAIEIAEKMCYNRVKSHDFVKR